jgi:hypothetical protein
MYQAYLRPSISGRILFSVPQVTLYVDEDTDAKARAAARAAGVSYSRWVADLIRSRTRDEWPDSIKRLAGIAPDFPLQKSDEASDIPRVALD